MNNEVLGVLLIGKTQY